jgi:hypothetical protein
VEQKRKDLEKRLQRVATQRQQTMRAVRELHGMEAKVSEAKEGDDSELHSLITSALREAKTKLSDCEEKHRALEQQLASRGPGIAGLSASIAAAPATPNAAAAAPATPNAAAAAPATPVLVPPPPAPDMNLQLPVLGASKEKYDALKINMDFLDSDDESDDPASTQGGPRTTTQRRLAQLGTKSVDPSVRVAVYNAFFGGTYTSPSGKIKQRKFGLTGITPQLMPSRVQQNLPLVNEEFKKHIVSLAQHAQDSKYPIYEGKEGVFRRETVNPNTWWGRTAIRYPMIYEVFPNITHYGRATAFINTALHEYRQHSPRPQRNDPSSLYFLTYDEAIGLTADLVELRDEAKQLSSRLDAVNSATTSLSNIPTQDEKGNGSSFVDTVVHYRAYFNTLASQKVRKRARKKLPVRVRIQQYHEDSVTFEKKAVTRKGDVHGQNMAMRTLFKGYNAWLRQTKENKDAKPVPDPTPFTSAGLDASDSAAVLCSDIRKIQQRYLDWSTTYARLRLKIDEKTSNFNTSSLDHTFSRVSIKCAAFYKELARIRTALKKLFKDIPAIDPDKNKDGPQTVLNILRAVHGLSQWYVNRHRDATARAQARQPPSRRSHPSPEESLSSIGRPGRMRLRRERKSNNN